MTGAPLAWRWGDPVAPLAALLARGGLLAIPTESSYGLAADPRNPAGVAAVYRVKGRPADQPLPVVVAGPEQLPGLGIDPDLPILRRLSAVWPGPLSLLLPFTAVAAPLPAAAGAPALAVRVPAHARLRELLAALGTGLTATSANRSGRAPVLDPGQLAELLAGEEAAVIDDGRLPGDHPRRSPGCRRRAGWRSCGRGASRPRGCAPSGTVPEVEANRPAPVL